MAALIERGNMAAVAINGNSSESAAKKSLLLRVLDSLAEWLMRQELRIISRGKSGDKIGGS